jgi:stage II sporulation protein D
MKKLLAIIVATFLSMTILPMVKAVPSEARVMVPQEFRFFGSGYGHGVGMSQIGARGQALEGRSATEILNYYYPGTEVTEVSSEQLIRVNIANLATSVVFRSPTGAELLIFSGDIASIESPEPTLRLPSGSLLTFTHVAGVVVLSATSSNQSIAPLPPAKAWTLRWDNSAHTIQMTHGTNIKQYKYGFITVKNFTNAISSYLAVTNTLRLHDEYLYGLGEVPSSWPPASLDAQVIAARTYALNKLIRVRPECDCNIYSSTVDQNFVGYSKEIEPIYGIRWKEAVNRTIFADRSTALAVTLNSRPINAFYFSSSGGSTQNIKDVWGSEFSYLMGVPDPWSLDLKINQRFALWSRFVTQEIIATAFSLPNVVKYTVNSRSNTGSVLSITGYSLDGQSSTLTGEIFRSRTKLPSTWIHNSSPFLRYVEAAQECQPEIVLRRQFCLV